MRFSHVTIPLFALVSPIAAYAQAADSVPETASEQPEFVDEDGNIVVIANLPRGSVFTDVPPVETLNSDDIESFGASSIQDLLSAISTSTSSGRGRGTGRPIVLINGQRTSGFRDIRDLPPEAIQTVQVFPEELALQYGYRPDQRVINFVLKENYFGISAEFEYGIPTQGGQGRTELESTLSRIGTNIRLNFNIEYQNETPITEAERDIVQDAAGTAVGLGDFRTLVAPSDNLEANLVYSRTFKKGTSLSLNAGYVYDERRSLLGLPGGTLTDPATGIADFRHFEQFGPLRRNRETNTFQTGGALNGKIDNWRWSLTADYERTQIDTRTDRSGDVTALQAAIDAGAVNITDADFGVLITAPRTDEARSINQQINSLATLSGTLFDLPSGPVLTTFRAGYNRRDLDSREITNGVTTITDLGRDIFSTGINVELPLADENSVVSDAIGRLLINGNVGYSDLSDFGGLFEFGFGVNWEPFDGFTITASAIGEEAAPSISQLGNPVIVTPNVNVFDFTRGESVLASITTGGNPGLVAEKRRDIKVAVNYRPQWLDGMTFLAEYFRNNSDNVASSFPLLTPEIEAAFPGRVTRGNAGHLIAIDRRPVSYSNVYSERIRYGFNFRKRFGQRRGGRGGRPPGAGSGRPGGPQPASQQQPGQRPTGGPRGGATQTPKAEGGPPAQARSGRGRRPGGFGRRRGGRWFASAYHTIRLEDRIVIRRGVQELDLLNGSATGSTGGTPRHEFELSGGWFNNGLGFRVQGKHQSGTRVNGGLTGSDLQFSDLTTLNLRMFINLDNRGNLTKNIPLLRGSRIAFRIDNIFNDIQDVRDSSGLVPLNYQRGFVDPVGRYFEIDFRKRF